MTLAVRRSKRRAAQLERRAAQLERRAVQLEQEYRRRLERYFREVMHMEEAAAARAADAEIAHGA